MLNVGYVFRNLKTRAKGQSNRKNNDYKKIILVLRIMIATIRSNITISVETFCLSLTQMTPNNARCDKLESISTLHFPFPPYHLKLLNINLVIDIVSGSTVYNKYFPFHVYPEMNQHDYVVLNDISKNHFSRVYDFYIYFYSK